MLIRCGCERSQRKDKVLNFLLIQIQKKKKTKKKKKNMSLSHLVGTQLNFMSFLIK